MAGLLLGLCFIYNVTDSPILGFLVSWNFLRVGIDLPKIEVRFEHLNVGAEAYVGSRALPTIFNFLVNIVEVSICK